MMSDHCRFLFIPAGGPARVIHAHPWPSVVSDLLGGAIPAPIVLTCGTAAAWLRETCSTEGQPRNILASVLAMVLGQSKPLPILGPCALTLIEWESDADPAQTYKTAVAAGFPGNSTKPLTNMAGDVHRALQGDDDGFSSGLLDAEWAAAVRRAGESCRTVPVPDGWPGPGSQHSLDEVSFLMRRLGLGEMFASIGSSDLIADL